MDGWTKLQDQVVGNQLRISRLEHQWDFDFGGQLRMSIEASWRLRNNDGILLTDSDDGHQFGLSAPVDAETRGNELLNGAEASSFKFDNTTADLKIAFTNGILIEVLTTSSGYESWQAYVGGELLAVGGNGGLR